MLAYSAVQFPAGALGDHFGRPVVIASGATVFAGAALLAAVGTSFAVILVAAVLIGLATGPHKAVAIPLLSTRYEDRTGRALGAMDTIGQFGGVTAPLVVVAMAAVFVWRGVFLVGGVVSLLFVLLFVRRVRADPELSAVPLSDTVSSGGKESDVGYLTVFSDRRLMAFMLVTMLFTFSWNGLSAFFPLFLTTEKGLSSDVAGVLYSLLFIASLSQAVTGDLSDKVGRLTIGAALFGFMLLGLAGLLVAELTLLLAVLAVVTGVGFHGFRPVRDSYLMDVIPDEVSGGTLGVIRTFMTAVGALAPATVGYLSDAFDFTAAFGTIGAALVAATAVVVVLRE
jgi:MFS family permease